MKKLTFTFVILILICFSCFPNKYPWEFKVPVKLKNICSDHIKSFHVHCRVYSDSSCSDCIGMGISAPIFLSNGNFDGIITVKVGPNKGKDPSAAIYYKCYLESIVKPQNKYMTFEEIRKVYPNCVFKPGTNFIVYYKGPLK